MKVPDRNLRELREQGFTIVEGFLASDELNAAQEALWLHYPRPEEYFADPSAHHEYTRSQFDGTRLAPWQSWDLNRLAFHPDLVDLAERFLGSADLHLYNAALWAKYAGAIDYDQVHHRDFVNHSLVVPNRDDPGRQMTSFVLLSDVDDEDGPTKVVPLEAGAKRPYWPKGGDEHFAGGTGIEPAAFAEAEVSVTGPAGTLFTYRTDVLHRGSQITGERRARFVLLADYQVWGSRWTGRMGWPMHSLGPHWTEMIERATPRERELFGFPGDRRPLLERPDAHRRAVSLPADGHDALFRWRPRVGPGRAPRNVSLVQRGRLTSCTPALRTKPLPGPDKQPYARRRRGCFLAPTHAPNQSLTQRGFDRGAGQLARRVWLRE